VRYGNKIKIKMEMEISGVLKNRKRKRRNRNRNKKKKIKQRNDQSSHERKQEEEKKKFSEGAVEIRDRILKKVKNFMEKKGLTKLEEKKSICREKLVVIIDKDIKNNKVPK
jgi:hypothetical protein